MLVHIMKWYYHASLIDQDVTNGDRPLHQQVYDDIQELNPDVIVERYLDAKYYQYSPEDIQEMSDYNSNATNLAESDQIVTLTAMETEDPSMLASIQDNLQELISSVLEWEQETQSINPKWLEHHQSGHLVKDPGCPVCVEEAGSKVNHRRKKADRHPGVMHCDLASFEAISRWSQVLSGCSSHHRSG